MKKQMTLLAAAMTAAMSLPALAADPFHLVVEYKKGQGQALKAQLADKGIGVRRELANYDSLALDLTKEQYLQLVEMDGIAGISVDAPRKLMSLLSDTEITPYGIPMVQADQVQYLGGKKVCIIDSGYDLGHQDLPSATVTGADDGGAGPWNQDGIGHGTHVAGTVAATGGNGQGVVGVNSVPMDLHIVRVFNGDGNYIYASDLVGAISDCADAGASVISMSLGGGWYSTVEERAIEKIARDGVLLIAAAGNDENAAHSYPASYDGVMSVAAVNFNGDHASFSQRTSQVEIAAPGVITLSTVPRGMGKTGFANVSQDGANMEAIGIVGSAQASATAALVDCGLGDTICSNASGKNCLIERGGDISFLTKINSCKAGGGLGVVIYNNLPGIFAGTLGTSKSTLAAVSVSKETGMALKAKMDMEATVSVAAEPDYDYKSGTSMATPHVSGVAAKVWSHFPECTAAGIRHALTASAKDLAAKGYDYKTGWGLVQAKDAVDYIAANGCQASNGKYQGGNGKTGNSR